MGWRLLDFVPAAPKYVIIGAPHTSNVDWLMAMLYKYATSQQMRWIGKREIFRPPFRGLMIRLGGIPLDRAHTQNFVEQMVEVFARHEQLCIAISPEGTRRRADYWRTGFYYMALGANVPIALAKLDYGAREIGIGEVIQPSGDLPADFARIAAYYAGVRGRRPERQGPVALRSPAVQEPA
jgi:1-acyl-sn-glycerol-3-phosphate acyltransferase